MHKYYTRMVYVGLLAGRVLTGCVWAADDAPLLRVDYGTNGLSSLRHAGEELLEDREGGFALAYARLGRPQDSDSQYHVPSPPKRVLFDRATKTKTLEYNWGTLSCRYEVRDRSLDAFLTVENKSSKAITGIGLDVLKMRMPASTGNQSGYTSTDGLNEEPRVAVLLDGYQGPIGLCNWESGRPVNFDLVPRGKGDMRSLRLIVRNRARPEHPVYDLSYFESPEFHLEPGDKTAFHLSIGFGNPGDRIATVCREVLDDYAERHPFALKWDDHRPIGALFMTRCTSGWTNNPRGWITGLSEKEDITTEAGLEVFREGLMKYAERSIAILKDVGAQGVIMWDIEGQEFPHFISYVGEPEKIGEFTPEMDRFADEFFKKFTDEGLSVGICIRPTETFFFKDQAEKDAYPYMHAGNWPAWHKEVEDPGALLNRKIAYAKERWGCTLFYFDSNVVSPPFLKPKDGSKPVMRGLSNQLPLAMYRKALEGHDDVLLMPEWSSPSFFGFSAPYFSPNLRQTRVPQVARALYPDCFAAIMTEASLIEARWDEYLYEVRHGSTLLFNTWFPSTESKLIKMMLQTVELEQSGVARPSPKAGAGLRRSSPYSKASTNEQWQAKCRKARSLGDAGNVAGLPELMALLKDKELIVCKSAMDALAALPHDMHVANPTAVNELIRMLKKPSGDERHIRFFTAQALGGMGTTATEATVAMLESPEVNLNEYTKKAALGYAVTVFSGCETLSDSVVALLAGIVADPEGNTVARERIARLLGEKRVQATIPALVKVLENTHDNGNLEELSCAAVVALGNIGDKSAIGPLIANWDRGYWTVTKYHSPRDMNEALAKLTGEETLIGKDAWQAWWTEQATNDE